MSLRPFIHVTPQTGNDEVVIKTAHIVLIAPTSGGSKILTSRGPFVIVKESVTEVEDLCSALPTVTQ